MNDFLKKTIENALDIKINSVHYIDKGIIEYKTIGLINNNVQMYIKIKVDNQPIKDEKYLQVIKEGISAFEKAANNKYENKYLHYIYGAIYEQGMSNKNNIFQEVIKFTTEKELQARLKRYIEAYIKENKINPTFKEVYLHSLQTFICYVNTKHQELLKFIEETERGEIEYERINNVK